MKELLAVLLGLVLRLSNRRGGVVLVYHALAVRRGDPAHELVPAHGAKQLEAQLQHLARHYRLVRPRSCWPPSAGGDAASDFPWP